MNSTLCEEEKNFYVVKRVIPLRPGVTIAMTLEKFIGMRFRKARKELGMTSSEIGKLINKSGVYLRKVEGMWIKIHVWQMVVLMDLYDLTFDGLYRDFCQYPLVEEDQNEEH